MEIPLKKKYKTGKHYEGGFNRAMKNNSGGSTVGGRKARSKQRAPR